jgi:hypothetical protein
MPYSFTDLDQLATHTIRGLALDGAYKSSAQLYVYPQSCGRHVGVNLYLRSMRVLRSVETWVSFGYPAAQALVREG